VKFPKFEYFRSKQHLKNVASLPCQHCGIDGQTQAAHSNWGFHGKGRSIKASDEYTAALCVVHHYEVDQGAVMTRNERQQLWIAAHKKTVAALKERGLWPDSLPQRGDTCGFL